MKSQLKSFSSVFFFVIILFSFNCKGQQPKSLYHIANKFSVEGDGGWDYLTVDTITERLYISHGNVVQILDVKTGKLLGSIKDLKGVHGIVIADESKGYITSGKDSSITLFNAQDYFVIGKAKFQAANPDAILYDRFSHRVFVFNGRSNNVTVLSLYGNKLEGMIELDGKPEFAVTNKKGEIYVNIENKNKITIINSISMKVDTSFSLGKGVEPSGLAIDIENNRLFSVCDNKVMVVMDAANGKIITTLPIGEGVDGVVYDPGLKRIYSSNGEGTVTVIQQDDANSYKVLETIITQKGARTIALDKTTHHIYLPVAEFGEIVVKPGEDKPKRPPIKPGTFLIYDIEPVK